MTTAPSRTPLPDLIEGHGFADPENRIGLHRAVERHSAEHPGGRRADELAAILAADQVRVVLHPETVRREVF